MVGAVRDIASRNREMQYFSFLNRRVLMPSQSYRIGISPCRLEIILPVQVKYRKERLREACRENHTSSMTAAIVPS